MVSKKLQLFSCEVGLCYAMYYYNFVSHIESHKGFDLIGMGEEELSVPT